MRKQPNLLANGVIALWKYSISLSTPWPRRLTWVIFFGNFAVNLKLSGVISAQRVVVKVFGMR